MLVISEINTVCPPGSWLHAVPDVDDEAKQDEHHAEQGGRELSPLPEELASFAAAPLIPSYYRGGGGRLGGRRLLLRLDAGQGDADDAVVEPRLDGLEVAAVGHRELQPEAAPPVGLAGDGALAAHDQPPPAADQLHLDVLLLVPFGGEIDGEGVRGRLADHLVRRLEVLVRAAAGAVHLFLLNRRSYRSIHPQNRCAAG